jgi:hypothetical protein
MVNRADILYTDRITSIASCTVSYDALNWHCTQRKMPNGRSILPVKNRSTFATPTPIPYQTLSICAHQILISISPNPCCNHNHIPSDLRLPASSLAHKPSLHILILVSRLAHPLLPMPTSPDSLPPSQYKKQTQKEGVPQTTFCSDFPPPPLHCYFSSPDDPAPNPKARQPTPRTSTLPSPPAPYRSVGKGFRILPSRILPSTWANNHCSSPQHNVKGTLGQPPHNVKQDSFIGSTALRSASLQQGNCTSKIRSRPASGIGLLREASILLVCPALNSS